TTNSGFGGVNVTLIVGLTATSTRVSGARIEGQRNLRTKEQRTACNEVVKQIAFVPPKHFARFSSDAQRASLALAEKLSNEGLFLDANRLLRWNMEGSPLARVGLLVWNREGSLKVNRAYFTDYVTTGSVLGRGQLFAATLPTSVASEVAIAFRLIGPIMYVADKDGSDVGARHVAEQCIADGLADAMILLDVGEAEVKSVFVKEGHV
ncbi:MAG: hypothetical protein WCJ02_05345, partial [bacterium]